MASQAPPGSERSVYPEEPSAKNRRRDALLITRMPGLRTLVAYVGRALMVVGAVAFVTPFLLAFYTFALYPAETLLLFVLGPVLALILFAPGVLILWLAHDDWLDKL